MPYNINLFKKVFYILLIKTIFRVAIVKKTLLDKKNCV